MLIVIESRIFMSNKAKNEDKAIVLKALKYEVVFVERTISCQEGRKASSWNGHRQMMYVLYVSLGWIREL